VAGDPSPPARGWGEEGNLTRDQIKAFQATKKSLLAEEHIKDPKDTHLDMTLLCYLRARNFDVEATKELFVGR
jgi:hypothetical protein